MKVITLDENTRNTLSRVVSISAWGAPQLLLTEDWFASCGLNVAIAPARLVEVTHLSSCPDIWPQSSRISSKAISQADEADVHAEAYMHNHSEDAKAKIKAGRAKANEELKYLCREINTLKVLDHCACPCCGIRHSLSSDDTLLAWLTIRLCQRYCCD